jgi:hypothetical protein
MARFLSRRLCLSGSAAAHEWAESRPGTGREGKSQNSRDGFSWGDILLPPLGIR